MDAQSFAGDKTFNGKVIAGGGLVDASGRVYVPADPPHFAAMSLAAAQNLASATGTVVAFDTVISDADGALATGAAAKWRCPRTGLYAISCGVNFTSNTSGTGVWLSGAKSQVIAQIYNGTAGQNFDPNGVAILSLTAGDTIQLNARQESGATRAIGSDATGYSCFFRVSSLGYVPVPSFASMALSTAGQSIPSGVATQILFDTVVSDADHTMTAGADARWACPADGAYMISCGVGFVQPTKATALWLTKNGSNAQILSQFYDGSVANQYYSPCGVAILSLSAGDVIRAIIQQGSGGALSIGNDGSFRCYLNAVRVG